MQFRVWRLLELLVLLLGVVLLLPLLLPLPRQFVQRKRLEQQKYSPTRKIQGNRRATYKPSEKQTEREEKTDG